MNTQEWALIIFTILAQMAVGSFLVLGVVHTYARRKAGDEAADRLSDRALLAIGPVLILAMIASLFHLGSPVTAYRAVVNVGTSWLSREILFGVLFVLAGGLFALMQWRKIGSFGLRTVVAWIAGLIGLVFIASMTMVYMIPAQPAWNTWLTPIAFFTTTALLGLFTIGASFVFNYNYLKERDPECADEQCALLHSSLRGIAVASILFLGIQLVTIPIYLVSLSSMGPAGVATARMLTDDYIVLLALQLSLLFLGAGVFALFLYRYASGTGREQLIGRLAYGAFLFVLVGAVIGRYLFYASHVRIGV